MASRSVRCLHDCVRAWVLAVALVGVAPHAWSQTVSPAEWHRGTTLAGFFGAASISADTDAAAGLALGWELTPHFTLEGRGTWFDTGPRADAFAAVLGARVPLLPARPVGPFLSGGVGMHRATFDAAYSGMPQFYRRRMSGATAPRGETFDDFAVALGGGVDIFLARHLAVRPELTLLVLMDGSDRLALPVYGVQLAYHFESHPITPARRVGGAK
jgi:hypothetical protein